MGNIWWSGNGFWLVYCRLFMVHYHYWVMGAISFLMNILWLLISGIWLAIAEVITGAALCITIIGIPFGLQHFKYATLALMPFGTRVEKRYY